MIESHRQKLRNAVVSRLEGIQAGNSVSVVGTAHTYQNTFTGRVQAWREAPKDIPVDDFFIKVRDRNNNRSDFGNNKQVGNVVAYEIDIITNGQTSIDMLDSLLVDIQAAIGSDETWEVDSVPLAHQTNILADGYEKEVEGQIIADATLDFEVLYRTLIFTS